MYQVKSLKQSINIVLELNKKGFFEIDSDISECSTEYDMYEAVVEFCEYGCEIDQDYASDIREAVQMVSKDYFFNY